MLPKHHSTHELRPLDPYSVPAKNWGTKTKNKNFHWTFVNYGALGSSEPAALKPEPCEKHEKNFFRCPFSKCEVVPLGHEGTSYFIWKGILLEETNPSTVFRLQGHLAAERLPAGAAAATALAQPDGGQQRVRNALEPVGPLQRRPKGKENTLNNKLLPNLPLVSSI